MKTKSKKGVGNPLVIAKAATNSIKKAKDLKKANPNTFKVITFSILGLVGVKIVSDAMKKGHETNASDSFTEGSHTETLPSGHVLNYNPTQIASEYDNAMGTGWTGEIDGTTVNSIINLAVKSRGGRWKHISQAYKKQTGKVLLTKIKSELHALEFKAFLAVLNEAKPSTYNYSIGELLNLKQLSNILVYNTLTKKTYKDSFYVNGSFIGVVKKRSTGPKKGSAWYTLSKYPDLQIHQNYLIRAYDSYAQQIWIRTGV